MSWSTKIYIGMVMSAGLLSLNWGIIFGWYPWLAVLLALSAYVLGMYIVGWIIYRCVKLLGS